MTRVGWVDSTHAMSTVLEMKTEEEQEQKQHTSPSSTGQPFAAPIPFWPGLTRTILMLPTATFQQQQQVRRAGGRVSERAAGAVVRTLASRHGGRR